RPGRGARCPPPRGRGRRPRPRRPRRLRRSRSWRPPPRTRRRGYASPRRRRTRPRPRSGAGRAAGQRRARAPRAARPRNPDLARRPSCPRESPHAGPELTQRYDRPVGAESGIQPGEPTEERSIARAVAEKPAALFLILLMAIGSVFLWLCIPVGWVWIASHVVKTTQPTLGPYLLILVGVPLS